METIAISREPSQCCHGQLPPLVYRDNGQLVGSAVIIDAANDDEAIAQAEVVRGSFAAELLDLEGLRIVKYLPGTWGQEQAPNGRKARRDAASRSPNEMARPAISFEDNLHPVEEHVAEARRLVQRQKGLIVRLKAAGANTLDAQRILWLLDSNLRRFEKHRDRLRNGAGRR